MGRVKTWQGKFPEGERFLIFLGLGESSLLLKVLSVIARRALIALWKRHELAAATSG